MDEDPCLDAYRHVCQVMVEDLRDEHDRWPHVAATRSAKAFWRMVAFPLRLRGDCIGALNLYREEPGGFDDDGIRLGQAFADVAAIGILQERKVSDAERRADQFQTALHSRVVIEQARGPSTSVTGWIRRRRSVCCDVRLVARAGSCMTSAGTSSTAKRSAT